MKLIKYRDAGLPTYTFFWVNDQGRVMGPYFDSEAEAVQWLKNYLGDETEIERIVVNPSK